VTVKARNAGIIAALETGGGNGNGGVAKVISSCNKWQPVCYTVYNFSRSIQIGYKLFHGTDLRFNPIQIAEWLDDLLVRKAAGSRTESSRLVEMSRTRVGQFLNLMKLPEEIRLLLREEEGLTEYQLRRMSLQG